MFLVFLELSLTLNTEIYISTSVRLTCLVPTRASPRPSGYGTHPLSVAPASTPPPARRRRGAVATAALVFDEPRVGRPGPCRTNKKQSAKPLLRRAFPHLSFSAAHGMNEWGRKDAADRSCHGVPFPVRCSAAADGFIQGGSAAGGRSATGRLGLCVRRQHVLSARASLIGGSSNGRTADSDSVNLGSNPSPPANHSAGCGAVAVCSLQPPPSAL